MKRVLWANCSGVGDVLLSLPVIKAWYRHHPQIHMAVVGNRRAEPILRAQSFFDEVWIFEKDEWQALRRRRWLDFVKQIKAWCDQWRRARFDAFVDFSMHRYLRWLAQAAGIPIRAGWVYRNRRWGLTHGVTLSWEGFVNEPMTWQHLRLLESLGGRLSPKDLILEDYLIEMDENTLERGRRLLIEGGLDPDEGDLLAVAPGGGLTWGDQAAFKRWPAERHAQVADKMFEIHKARVILLGDEKDREAVAAFKAAARAPVVDLTGRTDLATLLGVLACCRAALVNDGGPLHIAAAVATPVVCVMGPVDERVYGPLPTAAHQVITAQLVCRPCYRQFRSAACGHRRCLYDVNAAAVFEKMSYLWRHGTSRAPFLKQQSRQGTNP